MDITQYNPLKIGYHILDCDTGLLEFSLFIFTAFSSLIVLLAKIRRPAFRMSQLNLNSYGLVLISLKSIGKDNLSRENNWPSNQFFWFCLIIQLIIFFTASRV
jgi:hypothetical protein